MLPQWDSFILWQIQQMPPSVAASSYRTFILALQSYIIPLIYPKLLAIIFRKKLFRMEIQREYLSRNHSKFLLKYHIILVCKYRRKALVGDVGFAVKHILLDIAQESDFDIEVMETDKDHVHLLVSAPPKLSPL